MYYRIAGYSIIHPLGFTVNEVFSAIEKGKTAVLPVTKPYFDGQRFIALFSEKQTELINQQCPYTNWTRFEKILWMAVQKAVQQSCTDAGSDDTVFVIATTKGNIENIEIACDDQLSLSYSAGKLVHSFNNPNQPVIISSACISGLSAIITAGKLLQNGQYKRAVIVGADVINDFIISGFNSLFALSDEVCKPFDAERKGINLGEGSAAIVLEISDEKELGNLYYTGGAITNDANHISGPSRTGEELAQAITQALVQAQIQEPDFISLHGTATLFNDEMEANAINIKKLNCKPTHSLKPYFGHTLGAAGIMESIVCLKMLETNTLISSLSYNVQGTTHSLHIQKKVEYKKLTNCLKTMSGFGGCNAAVIFEKM